MIVSSLVLVIAMLALFQHGDRQVVALIFALLTLQHELLFTGVGGFAYFFSAALTDLFIVWAITRGEVETKLVDGLLLVSFGFMLLNAICWLMWEFRMPYEVAYESLSAALYLCAILSLLKGDLAEDGNYEIDWRYNPFRFDYMASYIHHKKQQKEISS